METSVTVTSLQTNNYIIIIVTSKQKPPSTIKKCHKTLNLICMGMQLYNLYMHYYRSNDLETRAQLILNGEKAPPTIFKSPTT